MTGLRTAMRDVLTELGYTGDLGSQMATWEDRQRVPADEVKAVLTELLSEAWDLTADRANAVRMILEENGLPADRIFAVTGKGDSEPMFPDDPYLAANRRVSILLMKEAPVLPGGFLRN